MGFSKNAVFMLDSMNNWPTESNTGVNFCVSLTDQISSVQPTSRLLPPLPAPGRVRQIWD